MTLSMLEQNDQDYFHVIFAGLKGGGKYLTGLRDYIGKKGFVISSLSTRPGLKWGEFKLSTHYRNLAQELVNKAQGKKIRIYAHSLGSLETLDLMKALADCQDLPHKALEIIFISPPGVGQKGFKGLGHVLLRLGKVVQNVGLYDQHHLFPLHKAQDSVTAEQRKLLLEVLLPGVIPDLLQQQRLIRELEIIDSALSFLQTHPTLKAEFENWYLGKRHLIIRGLLEKIFAGDHITEADHQEWLALYRENSVDIASGFGYLRVAVIFAFKCFKTLFQGMDSKIMEATEQCQKKVVAVKLGVAILGRDELVEARDLLKLDKLALAKNFSIRKLFFNDVEHASVAHRWSVIDALEAVNLGV